MIVPRYRIDASRINGAGKGLFLEEPVGAGRIIIAPDAIDKTYGLAQLLAQPSLMYASARWFEDRYTISTDWPDECFVNHSFEPSGLWHLGFVFAPRELPAGTEVTVDYRHLLPPGHAEDFIDTATGEKIVGLSWYESLMTTTRALAHVLDGASFNG
ncbi:MAG TPA: SET domain-containing protein [Dyella sp.]|uniref:SET domain-containing protein n=1 Tax=Dyella sp. TaxID=1869338 RepID=UPI002C3DCE3C|nr:SET domain-containing protein [Dyella sp.]HTV85693.1 SET domain-containing protein [Dyella sp.]